MRACIIRKPCFTACFTRTKRNVSLIQDFFSLATLLVGLYHYQLISYTKRVLQTRSVLQLKVSLTFQVH